MNIDKPCNSSSCEPTATGRRSKKAHGLSPMHTESLTQIFLTFVFSMQRDSKRICKCNRLRLLRFRLSCDMLFFAYIYCPKESKCHALARFVLFVRLLPFGQWVFDKSRVQKKHSRMNYIKLTTNLPNPTNIYHVEPKRFVLFVRLLPFGQWVFDKSRVRKKYIRV